MLNISLRPVLKLNPHNTSLGVAAELQYRGAVTNVVLHRRRCGGVCCDEVAETVWKRQEGDSLEFVLILRMPSEISCSNVFLI